MADNIVVMNQGKNPLVSYNFMLRVEGVFDIPCKAVHSFKKENEYEYIQEGGLNDYVHMRRKPISQPFTLTIERYVGTDYYDPLYNGAELVLPLILLVSRYHNEFGYTKRSYVFTGCTVMSKEYGELNGERSGLHTETIVIGYREMLVVTNPVDIPLGNWMDDRIDDTKRKSIQNKFATSYTDENAADNDKYMNKGNWLDNVKEQKIDKTTNQIARYAKSYKDTNAADNNKHKYTGNWMDGRDKSEEAKESTKNKYAKSYKDENAADNNKYKYTGNWMDGRNGSEEAKKSTKNKYAKLQDYTEDTEYIKKVMNKGSWMDGRALLDKRTSVKFAKRNVKDDERYNRGNWLKSKRKLAAHYHDPKQGDESDYLNKGNWMEDRAPRDKRTSVKFAKRNLKDYERYNRGNWLKSKREFAAHYDDPKQGDESDYLNKGNWMADRTPRDERTSVKFAKRNVKDDERYNRGNWLDSKRELASHYIDSNSGDESKYLNRGNWMDGRSNNDSRTSVMYATRSPKDFDKPEQRKWPTVSSARKIDSDENK